MTETKPKSGVTTKTNEKVVLERRKEKIEKCRENENEYEN